jgi:DNA-binding XRE family transcriptional regulator
MSILDINYDDVLSGLGGLKPAKYVASSRAELRQCRAARHLLLWSQETLAYHAGVAAKTVARFERGETVSRFTESLIRQALERGGAEFIQADEYGGAGLRLIG